MAFDKCLMDEVGRAEARPHESPCPGCRKTYVVEHVATQGRIMHRTRQWKTTWTYSECGFSWRGVWKHRWKSAVRIEILDEGRPQ